jgi:hypothetical protein
MVPANARPAHRYAKPERNAQETFVELRQRLLRGKPTTSLVWGSGRTVIRASVGRLGIRRSLRWRWSCASRISRVWIIVRLRRRVIAVGIGGSGIRSRGSRLRRCRARSGGRGAGIRRCSTRIWIGGSRRRLARGRILTRASGVASCRSCAA